MGWGGLGQGSSGNLPGIIEIRRLRGRLSLVLEDVEFGKVYDATVVFRLLRYVKPHLKLTIFSLLTMLLYIATQISVPLLVGLAMNQFIQNADLSIVDRLAGLDKIGIIFLCVAIANLIGNYLHLIGLAKVNQAILRQLRVQMHAHLQKMSTMFYDHNEVGRLMSRVQNDAHALQEFMMILAVGISRDIDCYSIWLTGNSRG